MKTLPLAFLVLLFGVILGSSSVVFAQCEPGLDCNGNGSADSCDIADNTSNDCDGDGIPDECQISLDPSLDCNQDSILDACEGSLEDLLTVAALGNGFGGSSDMSGDRLAIGAPDGITSGIATGEVYLYRNIGSRWVQDAIIQPPDSTALAEFGWSVAIDGDLLIVGSPGANSGPLSESRGAAYIYRHNGLNWVFEEKLEASNGQVSDEFGISVGISGDRAVVGAWRALVGVTPGSAYIYSHDGTTWTEDQILESNDPNPVKRFGGAVAIDGNTIAISDQRSDLGFLQQVGGVFLYTSISQTSWIFTQKITAQDPQEGSQFGRSLDISGTQIIVGAPIADGADGAGYLFDRTGFVYNQTQKFSQPAFTNAQLGIDVGISDGSVVMGAWRADGQAGHLLIGEADGAGGYTTFTFSPATVLSNDKFGESVAMAGRWVVGASSSSEYASIDRLIGAEDCNQNGIDDPCDIFLATSQDCDLDGVPDSCQIADGSASDCDADGVPDHCQLSNGSEQDCNLNGVIDSCDIASTNSQDCNLNSIPDDCEADCNLNGIEDSCEIADGLAFDCNGNGFLDACDIQFGFAIDCNSNGIPDSCDLTDGTAEDCNGNNALDICEITIGIATDCNGNNQIDQCELDSGLSQDCNLNQVPDICDIAYGLSTDCNGNMLPDECELSSGAQQDCNQNGSIDACELLAGTSPDCDVNGQPDECDIVAGALDCNANAILDICEVNADPNPPVISGLPAEVVVIADLGGCSAVATWDDPIFTDDCGVASNSSTHTSGSTFPVGSTPVSVTATDVSGNVTVHTFNVVVVDDQLPTISSAPANITVDNDPGLCTAIVTWAEPTASDNCQNTTIASDHLSGDAFGVGVTLVTYTVTDDSGNATLHSFEVTVLDVDLPSIIGLPGTVIVNSNPGVCTAQVSWAAPSIDDNCPGSTFTSDHQPGDAFPVGTTLISYTATDANGNQSAASFELTVIDNEMPQVSGIPTSIVLDNDPGSCGAVHSWAAPVATDNCGAPLVSISHNSGELFPIGTTNVTINVDDGHGNTLDFAFDVVVNDNELPVISGVPTSSAHSTETGMCTKVVDWPMPIVSDNCDSATLVGSAFSGSAFPVGDTEVTYTATDIHGNIKIESFLISVSDDELPTLDGVPVDMSADSTPGICGTVVAWPEPVIGDNCGIGSYTTTHAPGTTFEVGTTTVTYDLSDVNGNSVTQSFAVTVLDIEQPLISSMPADILLANEAGTCSSAATWDLPVATDNCNVTTLVSDRQSGEQFDVGTTTVTYTATDASGLESTATFQVIVEDTELPTIDGLAASVTVTNSPGSCDGLASWVAPTSSDNCGSPTLTSTHEPGWIFTVGDTTVTYTATDLHGNQSTAQILVTVLDDELPTIMDAPIEISLSSEPGQCTAQALWTEPTIADNCEVQLVETTHPSGSIFPVGSTTVTYTATDIHANSSQHSFLVIVEDMEQPQILDVPATVQLDSELDLCSAMATWVAPTAADNCEVLELLSSHTPGDTFPVGTTTVTLTATDIHTNSSTATFEVVVSDAQAPQIIDLPADIQLNAEPGLCSALASWVDPTGQDNCGVQGLSTSHVSGSYFDVGTTDVVFTLSDIHGNETLATIQVTVTDIEAPQIINLPERVTVPTVAGTCEGTTSWIDPDTADNCGVATLETDIASGSSLPVGETVVTYTVTDVHGNATSQSFIVTVEDQELPVLIGVPLDLVIPTDAGFCTGTAPWPAPTAQDNCGIDTLVASHQPGDALPKGITTVSITATDIHGNIQTESFLVTVHDDEEPVIVNIPLDITITAEAGLCGASVSWTPPTTDDNCDDEVILTSTHQPGDFFAVGTTEVTYTAADDDDNTSTASFLVTVTDDEAPALSGLSADINLAAEAGLCTAVVTWTAPTTSDNCEVGTLTSSHDPGDTFPVGSTEVSYTVTDIHSNATTASFLVIISDDEAPEFVGLPDRVTVPSEPGSCTAAVSWSAPTATDNCEVAGITLSHTSGDQFPVGDTVVDLTATDIHGNETMTSFIVTVEDLENPMVLDTPADISLGNDAGACGAVATWAAASASDNCEVQSLTSSHASGDFFDVGSTMVTLTALDIHGNSSSTSFLVTITDSEDPTISGMPADMTVSAEAGLCSGTASWAAPTSSDNCGIAGLTSTHMPGDSFAVGTTEVIYSTTDIHGNEVSSSFLVTVTDDEAPTIINLPERVTIMTEPDLCVGIVNWTDPDTADNCGVASLDVSIASGTPLPVGDTSVTYTVTDIHGNTHSETFIVGVEDQQLPEILDTPADISLGNDTGVCGAVATWAAASASDNCEVQSLTSSHASGDFFDVGSTMVTLTALDIHGNSSSTSFLVTITDSEDPTISGMPADMTLSAEAGLCSGTASWAAPTSSDNCGIASLTSTHMPGDSFAVGTTEVIYSTTDIHGNEVSTSFLVTVTDDEAPQIADMPADFTVSSEAGLCSGSASWAAPTSSDNCGIADLTSTHLPGDSFAVGTTQVTYTTTDIHGNSSSASFIVTVEDLESPVVLDTPADMTLGNDAGACGAVATWAAASASDNCGVQSLTSSHASGDFFDVGSTMVTLTALDIHGNSSSTSFLVTITDSEDPTISGMPADMTVSAQSDLCSGTASWAAPTSSDNCGIAGLTSTHMPGDTFAVGTTEVIYTTTDIHGNESSSSFFVTVTDDQAPSIDGLPSNMILSAEAGLCSASVGWTAPASSDNCDIADLTSTHLPGDSFAVGTTQVTYTTTDIHGNSTSESFTVTVEDLESPVVLDTPDDMTLGNDAGDCGAVATWAAASASDNCGVQSLTSSHASGDFFDVGSTMVTLTALDIHGNSSSTSFLVTITDSEDPTISGMPADMTVSAEAGLCSGTASWAAPTSSDNCGIAALTSTHMPGDSFAVGTTEVTYTTTDIHGNESSSSFLVTVTDDEAPSIDGLSADISISNEAGLCSAQVSWNAPLITDNCGVSGSSSTSSSGDTFPVGTTEVTYTATDVHGNMNSESFLVTVTDDEYPLILGLPADISVSNDLGLCGAIVNWDSATTTDNCSVQVFEETHSPGDYFPVGTTPVTYASTDAAGNRTILSFDITVSDTEDPQISGLPTGISVSNDTGTCGAAVTWAAPTASDNCGAVDLVLDQASGSIFPVGVTTVMATATDGDGNTSQDSFDIVVNDDESPQILGVPANISTTNDSGQCGAIATWASPSATDNCGSVSLQVSHDSGEQFPVGLTTVMILATDLYGNSSSSSFQILVEDDEAPQVLDTPSDITLKNDAGLCSALASWNAPGSADNCAGHSVSLSHQSGDSFQVGTTEVLVTASDAAGNTTTTSFTVTVLDEEVPTIDPSADITIVATAESCNAEVSVPAPAAADNCQVATVTNDYTGTADASGTYELGTTTFTWTVTDIHGNEASASQSVTVTVDETDCNGNGQPDVCEIASGTAQDCNTNGVPDECELDCNDNGTPDDCDIASGSSSDTNGNGTPDECEQQFKRGDANASGTINVTDPIYILQYVIGTGPALSCMDTGDCNDDESLDLSDAIYLLQHLFLSSTPPPAPYGNCGIDPDGQSIGCDSYPTCP